MHNTHTKKNSQESFLKKDSKLYKFYNHIYNNSLIDGYFEFNHACHAKHFDVTTKTIQRWIKKLIDLGFIKDYKCGANLVSRKKPNWQKLKRSRLTVVAKANNKQDVHLISQREKNTSMYTKNPIQFLKNDDLVLPFKGRTSNKYIQNIKHKAIKYHETGVKVRELEIKHEQQEILELQKAPKNLVVDMKIKAKSNKIQRLKDNLQSFKEVMQLFFVKLKNATKHNVAKHFWMICNQFRLCFRKLRKVFEPKSIYKVNFKPKTYEQELNLIQNFVPFEKIKQEALEKVDEIFYNQCLQGFRHRLAQVNHVMPEYWQKHDKFKPSLGKYYTIEILNFEFKAFVKQQFRVYLRKKSLGQVFVESKQYSYNV